MTADDRDEGIPRTEREALLTVAHGAVVTSGGFSLQRGLVAATEFVLAQGLGPVLYGIYALAWRIAQLLLRFVNFGGTQTLQRYVPAYEHALDRRRRVAGLAYLTTVAVGMGIWAALSLGAPWLDAATVSHASFPPALRLFGGLVVAAGLVKVHAALLRAVGSARGEVAFNRILRPGARLVAAATALALGHSVVGVAGAIAAGIGLLAVAGLPVTARATGIRPTLRRLRSDARRFFDHAVPVAMSSVGKVFQNRVDVLLVGALVSAAGAGVYNVVLVLVMIAWIPLRSFNQLMAPVASDLYASDERDALDAVYTAVTRLVLTAMLPIVAIQLVFGRELLSLFGGAYAAGYVPLVIYLGGVVAGSAVGANGWLLILTDHQYARMVLDWFLAVTNVTLTAAFVLEFGLAGAALGTGVAITAQNAIQILLLRRFEGLWPFDATFLRPIVAAAIMAVAMAGVRHGLGGRLAVPVGIVLGTGTFVAALLALGVDRRDRLVVRELAARYRRNLAAAVWD